MKIYTKERFLRSDRGVRLMRQRIRGSEPEHLHAFIEIVYIRDGAGIHGIDGVEYAVRRGTLLFINYRQTHYFKAEEQMELCNIILDPEWISEKLIGPENAFELLTLSGFSDFQQAVDTENPLVRFRGAERGRLERLIDEMMEEQTAGAIGCEAVMKAQTNILLALIFRKMSMNREAEGNLLTPEFLSYIRDHCAEKLSLEELSRSCFYNPSYFSRLFKEHYGVTLTEFVGHSRMERAQQLLETTPLSVEEIAERCGFGSRSSFYKQFRSRFGMTPQEWRKVKKEDKSS